MFSLTVCASVSLLNLASRSISSSSSGCFGLIDSVVVDPKISFNTSSGIVKPTVDDEPGFLVVGFVIGVVGFSVVIVFDVNNEVVDTVVIRSLFP